MADFKLDDILEEPQDSRGNRWQQDDETSFTLPDPVMDPPLDVQRQLDTSGDNLQNLRGELRQSELEDQKKRLVDSFYNEVNRTYKLRPEGRIDYAQFGIDDDGKTLYWTPGDKKIPVCAIRGKFRFLALSSLATKYGTGGAHAVRSQLGFSQYHSKAARPQLRAETITALQTADNELAEASAAVGSIELQDQGVAVQRAKEASDMVHKVETSFTDAEIHELLGTMDDPPLNLRELRGLDKALQTTRGELTNNLAKLTELDNHVALEKRKLEQAEDEFSRRRIAERLRNLEDERASRLEAAAANREALRSQINRIRETFRRILNEDTTLAERIRTLFREQGVTIASILTAIGMAISTLVLALTGGGGVAPTPAPKPSDKGGLKEWVKKHLQALGRALANLAGKAAAALPGILGSIVSWLLNTLGKAASWLAENLWAMAIAVGTLLLVAARDWLTRPQPKRD